MERSFTFDFLYNADRFFYVHVERIHIVVIVGYSFDFSVFTTVHAGEATG